MDPVCNYRLYIQNALDHLADKIGAKNAFAFTQDTEIQDSSYQKRLIINSKRFYIGLQREIPSNWMLRTTVDVISRLLERLSASFDRTSNWFFDARTHQALSAEDLSKELYSVVANWIFDSIKNDYGLDLYTIARISDMPYEQDKSQGTIMLYPFDIPGGACRLMVEMKSNTVVTLNSAKHVRKLLAGVGEDTALVFARNGTDENYLLYGLAEKNCPSPFRIELNGKNWKFYCGNDVRFACEYDRPKVWTDPLLTINHLLNELFANQVDYFDLLDAARKQRHGTSVVLMEFDACTQPYMDNLANHDRTFSAVPVSNLNPKVFTDLARMDGALVFDAKTKELKYFSTIVDGIACVQGDLGRGARHNGMNCFIANLVKRGMELGETVKVAAIAFSEDGGAKLVGSTDFDTISQAFFEFK